MRKLHLLRHTDTFTFSYHPHFYHFKSCRLCCVDLTQSLLFIVASDRVLDCWGKRIQRHQSPPHTSGAAAEIGSCTSLLTDSLQLRKSRWQISHLSSRFRCVWRKSSHIWTKKQREPCGWVQCSSQLGRCALPGGGVLAATYLVQRVNLDVFGSDVSQVPFSIIF